MTAYSFSKLNSKVAGTLVLAFFSAASSLSAAPQKITWDDLIPEASKGVVVDYRKIERTIDVADLDDFDGDKESYDEFVMYAEELRTMQSDEGNELAVDLDKQSIKIAGYATPIDFDGEQITEFLFVPYLGACMHVPPPPSNQIIYVQNAKGLTTSNFYDPVYLVGKLNANPVSTMVANVGYTIQGADVLPYDEFEEPKRLIEVHEY